jgi:hypothetical protein
MDILYSLSQDEKRETVGLALWLLALLFARYASPTASLAVPRK